MASKTLLVLALTTLVGCMVGSDPEPYDDVEAGVVVLEGGVLADELVRSPVHAAGGDFVRLGVIFDAAFATALELSTSLDGTTWSAWQAPVVHHVEQESVAGFVGQLELPAGQVARYYRIRGQATFLRMEEMVFRQSEHIESGDETPERAGPIVTPGVLSRAEWGARAATCSSSLGTVTRMAIHHTESPTIDKLSTQARLRQIQSYHMDVKGWCDIGYHYLVSRDGRVWQGRPVAKLGTHAGGANTGNVGVAVIGSHDTTPVTDVQVTAIADLIAAVARATGIKITRTTIKGHREYKDTSCPGDRLLAQLVSIVAAADAPASAPPPDTTPTPPPPTSTTVKVIGVLYAGESSAEKIAGATITIAGKTTTTGTDGSWELSIAAGSFTVTASKTGFITRTLARTTLGTETWASFSLSKANAATGTAILQGVIYRGSNSLNRIANASITLSTGQTITTDANGYYKLTSLPAGTVTITASAAGYSTASVSRTLASGITEWGSVKLAP